MSLLNPDIHKQDCLPRVGSVYKIEIEVALNYLIPTIDSLDGILRSRISEVVALDNMSEDISTILWDVINNYLVKNSASGSTYEYEIWNFLTNKYGDEHYAVHVLGGNGERVIDIRLINKKQISHILTKLKNYIK